MSEAAMMVWMSSLGLSQVLQIDVTAMSIMDTSVSCISLGLLAVGTYLAFPST
jgi:hypothetical protein